MTNQWNQCCFFGVAWPVLISTFNYLITLLFPEFNLPFDEHPQNRNCNSQYCKPSQPWQVLLSECLKCEEIVIHFKCEPWFFHCSVSSVFLVVVLKWFGYLWVDDVVFGESIGVWFDIESCRELTWLVSSAASYLADVVWRVLWKTTFISAKFIDVQFLSDQSVTKIYASSLTCLLFFEKESFSLLAWLLQHHSGMLRFWLSTMNHKHLWTCCYSR